MTTAPAGPSKARGAKRTVERTGDPGIGTLAELAYLRLRRDILGGILAPGAPLRPAELGRRYALGLSPLREALMRLGVEGLVTAEGQKGFKVAAASRAELRDLFIARRHMETLCLAEAIAHGDAAWEAAIVASFHLLALTPLPRHGGETEAVDLWEVRHKAFHDSLVAACPSAWLRQFHRQTFDLGERYRRLRMFRGPAAVPAPAAVAAEHRAIMDATLARDAGTACRLMADHVTRTEQAAEGLWADPPEASGSEAPVRALPARPRRASGA